MAIDALLGGLVRVVNIGLEKLRERPGRQRVASGGGPLVAAEVSF